MDASRRLTINMSDSEKHVEKKNTDLLVKEREQEVVRSDKDNNDNFQRSETNAYDFENSKMHVGDMVMSKYVNYHYKTCEKSLEYYLNLLNGNPGPAEQVRICSIIKYEILFDYFPYLVDLMLRLLSDPLYNLLLYKGKNMKNRIVLFCYLKSMLSQSSDVNRASMCYYLCCDLYEIEIYNKRKNTKILQIRHQFPHCKSLIKMRTRGFTCHQVRYPSFPGLILSFIRSIAFYDDSLLKSISDINKNYNKKRNLRNITTKSNLEFKHNLRFYYDLVKISDKLSEFPKPMKKRLLTVSLELFNNRVNYEKNIADILSPTNKILKKIHVSSSIALDSKSNGPFLINCIVTKKKHIKSIKTLEKRLFKQATTLMHQFDTVKELNQINDLDGIRNNILIAIEQLISEKITSNEKDIYEQLFKETAQVTDHAEEICDLFTNTSISLVTENNDSKHNVENNIREHFNNFNEIYSNAPLAHFPNKPLVNFTKTNTTSYIVKNGSVMHEEYYAFRIITQIKNIFIQYKLPIYLKNYKIIIITEDSGLVEVVVNSMSIHKIKQTYGTLKNYFESTFKPECVQKAKNNFLYSLVGYSLIQFVLSLKDRHNANILIDEFGHMVHIDFGYILGKYPGFYGVEISPFKFSIEYLDLVNLEEFKLLFTEGFKCLYNNKELLPIEIQEKLQLSGMELEEYCNVLIEKSVGNYLTILYDHLQYYQNGYKL